MHSATTHRRGKDSLNASRFGWKSAEETLTALAGVTAFLAALLIVAVQLAQAQTETVLHSFADNHTDGYSPNAALSLDAGGNLYGTTLYGGENTYGTVFKLSPSGTETILHSFAHDGADGFYPYFSTVALDKAGNLYGTTLDGGANGYGTVFRITPTGTETILHSFANGKDGRNPYGGVVLDKLGNLYGTTYSGGAKGYGIVFKISSSGMEIVLHSFAGGADGCYPYGENLVLGANNTLYGTTSACGANGYGTVFSLTPSRKETVLHSFANDGTDGISPAAGVILDNAGNLYGTTSAGGADGYGAVYKITPTGTESVLHSFANNGTDGANPYDAGVILDQLGNLYGTTYQGGVDGYGTVFKIDPSGTETILHNFAPNGADGFYPLTGLVLGKENTLYGTTPGGGAYGTGTVFRVVP